jgi:hypothetical protein
MKTENAGKVPGVKRHQKIVEKEAQVKRVSTPRKSQKLNEQKCVE